MGRTGLYTQQRTLQERLMGTWFLASANITCKTVPGNWVRASRTLSSEQKQVNHDCVPGTLTCLCFRNPRRWTHRCIMCWHCLAFRVQGNRITSSGKGPHSVWWTPWIDMPVLWRGRKQRQGESRVPCPQPPPHKMTDAWLMPERGRQLPLQDPPQLHSCLKVGLASRRNCKRFLWWSSSQD